MATAVAFQAITKTFPGAAAPALDRISFVIEAGELITILGTSGCGKTTLIRLINRLIEPDSGRILLDGKAIANEDPVALRQRIGYVIQQVGLFPHQNVAKNIATVPAILGWDAARIRARVDALLTLVNLDPDEFRGRYPRQLSGGQQQRVGLARALAADPAIMLLDEPFGAIDAINRESLQDSLLAIHRASQKTFLFVTHDIREAFKLGSRVLIMDRGRIEQFDTPAAIQAHPATDFVRALLRSSGAACEAVL